MNYTGTMSEDELRRYHIRQRQHIAQRAVFASKLLTRAGWVLAIGGPVLGLILVLASGISGGLIGTSDEVWGPGETTLAIWGGCLFVVGAVSGLFMVMISSFVRVHLDSLED